MPFPTNVYRRCPTCVDSQRVVFSIDFAARQWRCIPENASLSTSDRRRHYEEDAVTFGELPIERAPEIPPESPATPINYGGNYVY